MTQYSHTGAVPQKHKTWQKWSGQRKTQTAEIQSVHAVRAAWPYLYPARSVPLGQLCASSKQMQVDEALLGQNSRLVTLGNLSQFSSPWLWGEMCSFCRSCYVLSKWVAFLCCESPCSKHFWLVKPWLFCLSFFCIVSFNPLEMVLSSDRRKYTDIYSHVS